MIKEKENDGNLLNESLKSEGEVLTHKVIHEIENQIKKNFKDKSSSKSKKQYIELELFQTYLEQLQNACSHNLAVAQTYAIYLRQSEESITALTRQLEEKELLITELSSKINENIKKSASEITDIKFERERFSTLYLNYQKENEVLKSVLREKEKLMKEKDEMNDLLEKSMSLRLNEMNELKREYSEQIDKLVSSLTVNEKEKQALDKKLTSLKMDLIEKQSEVSKLEDKIYIEEKNYEKFYATMKSQYSLKDADYRLERSETEKLSNELEGLKLELAKTQNILEIEQNAHLQLKASEENLLRKCSGLETRMAQMVKEEVEKHTERLMDKIVAYEVKIQRKEEESKSLESENAALSKEAISLRSEMKFYMEKNEHMETECQSLNDEKKRGFDHMKSLKAKYEELISNMEKETLDLQKKTWNFQCENESLKIRIDKLEENEKLVKNFIKFKDDSTFLNLVHRLKDQDLVSISSSELARIKALADQDFQKYKHNIQDLRKIEETDSKINKESLIPQATKGLKKEADGFYDREWDELLASMNAFKPGLEDVKLKGASDRLSKQSMNKESKF